MDDLENCFSVITEKNINLKNNTSQLIEILNRLEFKTQANQVKRVRKHKQNKEIIKEILNCIITLVKAHLKQTQDQIANGDFSEKVGFINQEGLIKGNILISIILKI